MTSIDDLFKKPSLPSGSIKRKFEEPDAQQAYKASKLAATNSPHTNGKASVEDAPEDDDDLEAGPSLPPDDADDPGDDEEGRFFGGGVTEGAAQALDYLDEQDDEAEEVREERIDSAWLRRLAASFERKVNKNAELRAKYESEPHKFMGSEADLDAEIKSWSLMTEHSELYPEFAESGASERLVGLLAHENTDIAIGVLEILGELLDEDVAAESDHWDALVASLLDADLLDLLLSNLARLDESLPSDRSGVYYSLSVLEALASQPATAVRIGTEPVLNYLCTRIQKPETPVSQNTQYAAETLQILLQTAPSLRTRLAKEIEGVDLFLQLLARYRKRDPPKDSSEEEFAENVFDALTCVLDESAGKTAFVEAEGVELALIMVKEGGFSKSRALRVIDHAVGGGSGNADALIGVCERLVEAGGLKTLFSLFGKKGNSALAIEHLLSIFAALLRWLPGESAARIRTLNKFIEKDYANVEKLVASRQEYAKRLNAVDEGIALERRMTDEEDQAEREDEWFSRRLESGLFGLQTADLVLAWLVAEDAQARAKVVDGLGGVGDIRKSLEELKDGLGEGEDDTAEMFSTLVELLGSQ